MERRILVPMDGSPKSEAGLRHALSTYPGADITVLHVMTPFDPSRGEDPPLPQEVAADWRERARERANEILADAEALADEFDVGISTAVEVGEAWRAIVDYAEGNDVDHVVMGSHGREEEAPVPLGSVAETVMRRSPVLVSVVR